MPSYRRIKIESPRQGIMKSTKHLDDQNAKEKHIKIDFIQSRRTISIKDDESVSLDNHQTFTRKGDQITVKSIAQTKKGCLKTGDHSGLSLKKISLDDQNQIGSCRQFKSSKSIKFSKKTNVYVYKKQADKKQSKKVIKVLKRPVKQNPVLTDENEGDECCIIY